jgi:hypothetical protein
MAQGFVVKPPKVKRSGYPKQLPGESKHAYKGFCNWCDSERSGQPLTIARQSKRHYPAWKRQYHWAARLAGETFPSPIAWVPPEGAPDRLPNESVMEYEAFCHFWQAIQAGDRFPLESAIAAYKVSHHRQPHASWKDKNHWLERTGQTPVIPQGKAIEQPQLDMLMLAEGNSDRLAADLQSMLDYLTLELQLVRSARSGNLITPELVQIYRAMPPVPERLPEASRAGRRLLDAIFAG